MHHFNIDSLTHTLDRIQTEPKIQVEQIQVETTNPELAQGKPRCISPNNIYLLFKSIVFNKFVCALNL
jgi:hypothetical protein